MAASAEQQANIVRLLPLAHGIARRWSKDDEYISVAELALTEAVLRWKSNGMPLDAYVKVELWRRISTYYRSTKRRREVLTGDMSLIQAQCADRSPLACLPPTLLPIATAHWLKHKKMSILAEQFGLSLRECRVALLEAANMMREDRHLSPVETLR